MKTQEWKFLDPITTEEKTLTITRDTIPDLLEQKLPRSDFKRYLELHAHVQKAPKKYFSEMERLYQKYPHLPEVNNLFTFACLHTMNLKKVEQLIIENFQNNPDHFLAKINFADHCLRKKRKEEVSKLFPIFDITQLFPKQRIFHVSEIRGFFVFLGFYFLSERKRQLAQSYYSLAHALDPDHAGVKLLAKKLKRAGLLYLLLKWTPLFPKRLQWARH